MAGLDTLVNEVISTDHHFRRMSIDKVHSLIDEGVRKREQALDLKKPNTKQKLFRVSSIGYCMRKNYYAFKKKMVKPVDFLRKCDVGSAVHEIYQDYLAHTGKFLGNYFCEKCQMLHGPGYYTTGVCPNCGTGGSLKYTEFTLINRYRKIAGSPDGFVKVEIKNAMKAILTEFKTITPFYKIEERTNVDKYVPEHIHQANFYLGLIFDPSTFLDVGDIDTFRDSVNPKNFFLIYHDKGTDKKIIHPYKFDKEMYLEDRDRVAKFWKHIEDNRLPEKEAGSKCRYCDFLTVCTKKSWADKNE